MRVLANLLFSLNVVFPIFAVLLLGFVLRRKNFVTWEFVAQGNKLVFHIALPVSLFSSIYSAELDGLWDGKFVLFAVLVTLGSFGVAWGLAELFVKDKALIGTIVQGCFRGNFAILGLPLVHNIIGEQNSAKAALIVAFIIPIYNILAIVVLTTRSKQSGALNMKGIVLTILKNPLIIAIILGLTVNLLKIHLPSALSQIVSYVAALSSPLALLCLGGSIQGSFRDHKFKYALGASIFKVFLLPLLVVSLAYLLGFTSYDLVILLVMSSVPVAVSSFPMALQMGGDSYVAAANVMLTTLLSVFTITAFLSVFKAAGII